MLSPMVFPVANCKIIFSVGTLGRAKGMLGEHC